MTNIIYKESFSNSTIDLIKERIEYVNSYIEEIYSKKQIDEITDKEIEIIDKLKKLYKDIGDISEFEFQEIGNDIISLENYISTILEKQYKKEFIAMFAAIKSSIKDSASKQVDKPKARIIDPVNRNQNKTDIELKSKTNRNSENKESIKLVKSITKLVTSLRQQIKNVISSSNESKNSHNHKQQDSLNIKISKNDKKDDVIKIDKINIRNESKKPENKIVDSLLNRNIAKNFVESVKLSKNSEPFSKKIDSKSLDDCQTCKQTTITR